MNRFESSSHGSLRPWRRWLLLWLALIVVPALIQVAMAAGSGDKRMALVIGNARYPQMALTNPENDARVVASTLRRLGFDVTEHVNLGVKQFRKVLRDYARKVENEDGASVFYYAGHGVQIEGRNYLLPVDINLRDEYEIRDEGVDIDELFIGRLERARTQVRIVILDACRDNPFSTKTRAIRGSGGLAEMAARGALIAYATAPGATAEDGPPGTNSVFTRHLAKEMLAEGIEVEQMFKNVRVKVMRDTSERQVPWVNTSMTRNFSFNPLEAGNGDAAARREDLARLQALLDQREREQKKLEEQLEQMAKRLAESRQSIAPPPPAAAEAEGVVQQATAVPSAPVAAPALVPPAAASAVLTPPPSVPAPVPPPAFPPAIPSSVTAKQTEIAPAPPPDASGQDAMSSATYQAAKAWVATRAKALAARPLAPVESVATARPKPESRPPALAPMPPPPRPQPSVASGESDAALSQVALSRPVERVVGPTGDASERCVALLIRAQLGEAIRPAEMDYLKKECR